MSYLQFEFKGTSNSGKTNIWVVKNTSEHILGWIEWKATWRRYWFCPTNGTGFDADCTQETTDFLRDAMAARAVS